jgi:hypothetical protein
MASLAKAAHAVDNVKDLDLVVLVVQLVQVLVKSSYPLECLANLLGAEEFRVRFPIDMLYPLAISRVGQGA